MLLRVSKRGPGGGQCVYSELAGQRGPGELRDQCCGWQVGNPGDPVDSGSSRVLREGSLGLASWREAGLAQQSWPGCPVAAAVVVCSCGREGEGEGRLGSGETCGWLAGAALSAVSDLPSPQAVREGKWRLDSNAYCLSFSWEQSQERERCWQHLIQGQMRGEAHSAVKRWHWDFTGASKVKCHVLECVHEGQERNPGLLGFLQGWGKVFAGSSCHRDEALCSICVRSGLLLPWAPVVPAGP